jgi:hypothetical protein
LFNRVFELPLLRNAQKGDKKKTNQTTEGEKQKKNGRKKRHVFRDEPRWTFWGKAFFVFLNSLVTKRPKSAFKKTIKRKRKRKRKMKWSK